MMLSPHYSDVKQMHKEFDLLLKNWTGLQNKFPENIAGLDEQTLKWVFEKTQRHFSIEERLAFVKEYMMPGLMLRYNDGLCIKEFIYDHLHLSTVGIEPLNIKNGFLLLKNENANKTVAFRYCFNGLIDEQNRQYLSTEKVFEFKYSYSNSFFNMKQHLQRQFGDSDAVYLIESDIELPLWNSIRPVAKSKLAKYIIGAC